MNGFLLLSFILAAEPSGGDTVEKAHPDSTLIDESMTQDIPSIYDAMDKDVDLDTIQRRERWRYVKRDGFTAFWMSCFIPGLGHFYADEAGWGLTFIALELITGTWAVYDALNIEFLYPSKTFPPKGFGIMAFLTVKVWELVDAVHAADRCNRKHGFTLRTSQDGIGLGFVFRF